MEGWPGTVGAWRCPVRLLVEGTWFRGTVSLFAEGAGKRSLGPAGRPAFGCPVQRWLRRVTTGARVDAGEGLATHERSAGGPRAGLPAGAGPPGSVPLDIPGGCEDGNSRMCPRVVTSCRSRRAVPGGVKRGTKRARSGAPSSEGETRSEERRDRGPSARAVGPGEGPSGPLAGEGVPGRDGPSRHHGGRRLHRPRSSRHRRGPPGPSGRRGDGASEVRPTGRRTEDNAVGRRSRAARRSGSANRGPWPTHRRAGGSSSQANR